MTTRFPYPDCQPHQITVPAAAAWIGVPVGTPMSMPGWNPPQRGPNGLVIGPLTGQISPAEPAAGCGLLGGGADEALVAGAGEGADEVVAGCAARAAAAALSAARIFASISALAAAVALDSWIAARSCLRATISATPLLDRALESVCVLVSSSLWMIATCSRRALIRFV